MKWIIMVVCVAMLAGCARNNTVASANDDVESHHLDLDNADASGVDDPLDMLVTVTTDREKNYNFGGDGYAYFFRGFVDKKNFEVDYQLYTSISSFDNMQWDAAKYLMDGNIIDKSILRVGFDVKCWRGVCWTYEDQILKLTRSDIEQWSKNDLMVRFTSSKIASNSNIEIGKDKSKEFLDAMDKTVAFLKTQNAAKNNQNNNTPK